MLTKDKNLLLCHDRFGHWHQLKCYIAWLMVISLLPLVLFNVDMYKVYMLGLQEAEE